jgi:small subunit ribosomal protein S20
MPIKHAALKQLRKDRARILRNKAFRSELKTLKKRMLGMLSQQKREEALRLLPELMRRFDQAAAKGVIHKNTASRAKMRLMRRLQRAVSAPSPSP